MERLAEPLSRHFIGSPSAERLFEPLHASTEFPIARLDLFTSGDCAKAVVYLETKTERLAAIENGLEDRCGQIVSGSMFAAVLPFASAEVVVDSVEEMTGRGDTFSAPFL